MASAKTTTADATSTPKAGPRPRRAAQNGSTDTTTRRTRSKAAQAPTEPTPEETLAELAAAVTAAEAALAEARAKRDSMIAAVIAERCCPGRRWPRRSA